MPDRYVSGQSTYTTENAPIQLQEISNTTTSAVPRTHVAGPLGQLLAVWCGFISGPAKTQLRTSGGCLNDSGVMSQIHM